MSVDVKTSAPWTVHIKRNWIGWFYEATEQGSDGPPIVGPPIVVATPEEATHAAKARIDRIVQTRRQTPEPFEYTPAV